MTDEAREGDCKVNFLERKPRGLIALEAMGFLIKLQLLAVYFNLTVSTR